jgi:hypothetical protein
MAVLTAPASPPASPTTTTNVIVANGWRDPDRSRWLPTLSSAWSAPDALERPVVSISPPAASERHLGVVLRELQFALGKDPYVTGSVKTDDGDLDIPAAWLLVRRTQNIIVNEAARLSPSVIRHLIELAHGVGARIWLIAYHNRANDLAEPLEDWDAEEWTLEQFDRAWRRPTSPPDAPVRPSPPTARTTTLPASSALTFRAECRQTLPSERFAHVDNIYRRELLDARATFASWQQEGELTHNRLAAHIRRRVRDCGTTDELVTTVRALEAAALLVDFQLDVDLCVLINAAERNPRPGRNTDDDITALDAYTRPAYAAACVLAMLDVTPTQMTALTLNNVDEDNASVTTPETTVRVPEQMRPYLAAQRLTRQFVGAGPDDAFLVTEAGKAVHLSWIARTIKLAESECGVRLARPRYDRKPLTINQWMTVHGLKVRSLNERSKRQQRS